MKSITISVIINTFNRANYLRRLLAGLGHLRNATFEVIVVNGPSTDETATILNHYEGRIKVVDCHTRNLSQSRNLGIAAAAGDIVVFIDDDALPADVKWLARFAEAFDEAKGERIGAIGGSVLHRDTKRYEFHGGFTSDYGLQIFDRDGVEQASLNKARWLPGVRGANMAFRRKALVQVGGFDEFFTYYLEETDVCMRLTRAGFEVDYLPDNAVRHYAAWTDQPISQDYRKWRIVTRSDTYFALKNGRDPLFQRIINTYYLAPRKHFFREVINFVQSREEPFLHRLRLIFQWLLGFISGLWNGLFSTRQLGRFSDDPSQFLAFAPSHFEQRLNVALLTQTIPGQPNYGGVGRYTYDLARGLHERGHEVHILCKDDDPVHYESLGFVVHGIQSLNYQSRRIFTDKPVLNKNVSYSLAITRKLEELYAQGIEFDVVHASNWDAEAAVLVRVKAYPTVLMLVSPLAQVLEIEKWQFNDDFRACIALDRWQIENADVVCAPSEGVLGTYRELMGIDRQILDAVRTVHLGIVPDLGGEFTRSSNRRKLLFVGRLERRKGIHTLLEVLPSLLIDFPEWECHLVGNDQIPAANGKTFKELFLLQHRGAAWLERVIFHGEVTEHALLQQFKTCDLFVAPSLFESFGLIFQEAMQYGKAVVGCRTGGVPEVVGHGEEGLLVSPDNPAELEAALRQLMADESLRNKMGEAGAHRVRNISNYCNMAAQMEQIYLEAISTLGEERRKQRKNTWLRDLPIFDSSNIIQWNGPWTTQEALPRQVYRRGLAGASIEFLVCGGGILKLVALRHNYSGVLSVQANGSIIRYIDLFNPGDLQPGWTELIPLPGDAGETLEIKLVVHSDRNPDSFGCEVWIKQVSAILPQ